MAEIGHKCAARYCRPSKSFVVVGSMRSSAHRVARPSALAALRLGLLAGARHLDVERAGMELAGGDLGAAPGQPDRRVLAARRFDQAGALERADEVERG